MSDLHAKINAAQFKRFREKLAELKKPINRDTAIAVNKAVIAEMKDMITKGISPIEGTGRFPGYKNPKKYPGKKKPKTPVNLTLTGKMLKALKGFVEPTKSGYASVIQYTGGEEVKEEGHREGANKQPKRPTIPLINKGENFAQRILRVISRIYRDRIKTLKL